MKITLSLLAGLLLALTPLAVRADDSSAQVQSLLTKWSPSIVTVDVVIKMQLQAGGQGQDNESRMEMQGTVVTPDGLILLSDAPFDTKGMLSAMGMPSTGADMGIKITPTDFKVVIGDEEKKYNAFLAGTDPNLGLAFIKLEDLGTRTLQPVDFSSPATPSIGDHVYSLNRFGKGYDYAPYMDSGFLYGQIEKPQTAWVVSGAGDIGLPIFTADGTVIGMVATIPSGDSDSQSGGPMGMGMLMRMFGGHAGSNTFLVPASVLTGVITLAKQQAATVAAKLAAAPPAKPTPAPTKPQTAPVGH